MCFIITFNSGNFFRLHLAIQAYKELLMNVISMDKSEDENLRENAKIIKGKAWWSLHHHVINYKLLIAIRFVLSILCYSFLSYLSSSHNILRSQPQLIT